LRAIRPDVECVSDRRDAIAHLGQGRFVVMFPETGRRREWARTPAEVIPAAGPVSIVPVHVNRAPAFWHADRSVEIRIGSPIEPATLEGFRDAAELTAHLQWRIESLAFRQTYRTRTGSALRRWSARPRHEPVAPAVDPALLAAEVAALPESARVARSGDLAVYTAWAPEIPSLLREIGRLREIAFRDNDEGTGKSRDLDMFDQHYIHLFAWNEKTREVVGAYRLGLVDSWTRPAELYTATLFDYGQAFIDRVGPAIELGRSFVRLEYRKSYNALLLLWKGIGRFVAARPRYKILFGPVSISRRYQLVSRQLIVACLERWASWDGLGNLVRERNPFRRGAAARQAGAVPLDQLSDIVADAEPDGAGIPVLLRQYLKLGGKLLAFNLDREFSDVIDGLIVVDLTQTDPKLLSRYLGQDETEKFLSHHRGVVA
jgi:putative hemolysin